MLLGIDVSSCQSPATFPWARARDEDGVAFAVCKPGEKFTADPAFTRHASNARAFGLVTGSYWVFRPAHAGEDQAEAYAKTALGKTDLPPALDFELPRDLAERDRLGGVSIILARAEAFVTRTEKLWKRPVFVYTYPDFYKNTLGDPDSPVFAGALLWMASYPNDRATLKPNEVDPKRAPAWMPKPWRTRNLPWSMWQFDGDKGRTLKCGIDVDFDFVQDRPALDALITASK